MEQTGKGIAVSQEIRRAEQQLNHTDPLMVTEARMRIVRASVKVQRMETALAAAKKDLTELSGKVLLEPDGENLPRVGRIAVLSALSDIEAALRPVYGQEH